MAVLDPGKKSKTWDVKPSHKVRHTIITVLVTLLLAGGIGGGYLYFIQDTQTTISNADAKPITTTVKAPNAARAHFDESDFGFDLPSDWKRLQPDTTGQYAQYKYQSGLKNADNRYLSVYIDRLPLNLPVNKAVAVSGEGSTLTHGNVSENCYDFTARPSATAHSASAKWDGVDFICDIDGRARNVVGTSSPGMINKVDMTSPGFTKHSFFFLYEDNNYNPDYGIFYDMLNSFRVK